MTQSEVKQQRWNDTVEKLRQQLNLSEEEVITIKEWGIALLITGVSAWVLYRIVRTILGFGRKKVVKVKVKPAKEKSKRKSRQASPRRASPRQDPSPEANAVASDTPESAHKNSRSQRPFAPFASSPWFPLIKRYAGPLLLALARRQIAAYLRANQIIR